MDSDDLKSMMPGRRGVRLETAARFKGNKPVTLPAFNNKALGGPRLFPSVPLLGQALFSRSKLPSGGRIRLIRFLD